LKRKIMTTMIIPQIIRFLNREFKTFSSDEIVGVDLN